MPEKSYFVNFSNHPSDLWTLEQLQAAKVYGDVVDVPFPQVDPTLSSEEIKAMADRYVSDILEYRPAAVMCQGEFTLCYAVIERLKKNGITVLAACSERITRTEGNVKTTIFEFKGFREY